MLHLLSGDIIHVVAAGVNPLTNTELSNRTGQGGIADLCSLLFRQELMNALYVTITTMVIFAQTRKKYNKATKCLNSYDLTSPSA